MRGFLCLPITLGLGSISLLGAVQPAAPVTVPTPPSPVPARLQVVTFAVQDGDDRHRLEVTLAPGRLRVDVPEDGYSIVYDPASEFYIGLENRNYTYWEFSWPDVKAAVQNTARYQTRLKDLGTVGLNGYLPDADASAPTTNAPSANPFAGSDALLDTNATPSPPAPSPGTAADESASGYVWKPSGEKKRIAGLDCVRWTGESVSNEPVEAWCHEGSPGAVQEALARLRAINEPIALVPVRELVPPFVFEVMDDLAKGGVMPLEIDWGSDDDQDKSRFQLLGVKTREGEAKLFSIPPLYMKTTLVTMDGIGGQKVLPPPQAQETPKAQPQSHDPMQTP